MPKGTRSSKPSKYEALRQKTEGYSKRGKIKTWSPRAQKLGKRLSPVLKKLSRK